MTRTVDTQALRAEYADVTKDSPKVYRDVVALLDATERLRVAEELQEQG